MSDKWSIKRADDISVLFNFRCGVKAMDDFIHDKEKGWPNILNSSCLNFGLSMKEKKLWLFSH